MKKAMKKVLVLTLCLAMCLTMFAGCGKEASSEWYIGGSGPLTGGAAVYGIAVQRGAQIAVDEINAAGGINGAQIKWDMADDEHNAEKVVMAVNGLIDDGMQILMGAVTSAPSVEAGYITEENNILQITPSATAVDCIAFDNQYRVCFNDPYQGVLSAKFIADNYPEMKTVGVLYNKGDTYSSGIKDAFVAEVGSSLTIVEQAFTDETNTDFNSQIEAFKSAGCEFVFLPFYAEEAVKVFEQSKAKSFAPMFMGCDGLDGIIAKASSKDIIEGVVYITPFLATKDDAVTKAFVAAYEEAYGETPIQFAANAYDAIYIIKAAIEKAGLKDTSISASDLCDALMPVMNSLEYAGMTGTVTWKNGEPQKDAMFVIVKDGEATLYE